jgi:L-ribulose-5-phosphate 3-epimerase
MAITHRWGIYEKAIPNNIDWENKINIAKSAGYDFIEMSVDESDERISRLDWTSERRRAFKQLVEDLNFDIPSMCLSAHRRFPFGSHDPSIVTKAFEIMEKAIVLAVDLNIKIIQLAGYDVYYETQDEGTNARFLNGMKESAKLAEKHGIMLAIEIMDTPFMGTITKALEVVREVNSPYLKLYPDLGNLSRFSQEPVYELELGIHDIVQIHVKDTFKQTFKEVPFGEGDVKFDVLFQALKRLQYQGDYLIEMWAKQDQTEHDTIKSLKQAKAFVLERMPSC